MAQKYHPDKNPEGRVGLLVLFQKRNSSEAYFLSINSNPTKIQTFKQNPKFQQNLQKNVRCKWFFLDI